MAKIKPLVRTQFFIFTIINLYLAPKSNSLRVWGGTLDILLSNFGYTSQAVRSALSRMTKKGWLRQEKRGRKYYYYLTERSIQLTAARSENFPLYSKRTPNQWDGNWDVVVYSVPEEQRKMRYKLQRELRMLGFGSLNNGTWVTPYDRFTKLETATRILGLEGNIECFRAKHLGFTSDREIVNQCWDMEKINTAYSQFLDKYESQLRTFLSNRENGIYLSDQECFVKHISLFADYTDIVDIDPELPWELLPSVWHGEKAARVYTAFCDALAEAANRYFEGTLDAYEPEI